MGVIAHTVLGSADAPQTLVCHPGGPYMSGRYFGDLAGLAGERLRVVQVHPRGTAGSPPPADGTYPLERYADDLDELRAHLGLERLDLLGHSHGGFVAVTYAARHADRLGRLLLVCTAPRFSDELRAETAAVMQAKAALPGAEEVMAAEARRQAYDFSTSEELGALLAVILPFMLADPTGPGAEELRSAAADDRPDPASARWFNTNVAPTYDMRPVLPLIAAPTLVVNGGRDAFGPRVSARELAAIPGAHIAMIEESGHFPFLETPGAFAAEVGAFLGLD